MENEKISMNDKLTAYYFPPQVVASHQSNFKSHAPEKPCSYIKNSVLSILLLGLILFNLASLYRGIYINTHKLMSVVPCHDQSILNDQQNGDPNSNMIHVAFFGKYAYKNMKIVRGIARTIRSILKNTESSIHLHILLDFPSKMRIHRALRKVTRESHRKLNATYYDVEEMADNYRDVIKIMKKYFFCKDVGRYNDDIFFMSEIFHLAFPASLHKIIFLDIDLEFHADIQELHDEFKNFEPKNVVGIGPDLQPQYRVDFKKFRSKYPGTVVGSQRPGKQGFNTGVVLFDLKRMKESALYSSIVNETVVKELCDKYEFKGYLGHQDFFTLTGMEYPELYYELDCSWNRQLDNGWRKNVGSLLFDMYHSCIGKIKVYHGNGDARIPDE